MAKQLTQAINTQIANKDIRRNHKLLINGTDFTKQVVGWNISFDKQFGSASATFVLDNDTGRFSVGSTDEPKVGDQIELIESYSGDSTEFKSFFGKIDQRSIVKATDKKQITLVCLDYISILKNLDIDLISEGTKVKVENELMTPNFLPEPNGMFAQVFNFDNDAIADNPRPILVIRDRAIAIDDPQFDGFEVLFEQGQVKLGSPLNARDNFDLIARQYFFYVSGVFVEDIIEDILTQSDGYGNFLFEETSAQSLIDNHLTTTYQDEEGQGRQDLLTPNAEIKTITIRHTTPSAIVKGQTSITLDSIDGLPSSGSGSINGDIISWTNINEATKTLEGVPSSGEFHSQAHPVNSLFKYTKICDAGQLWNLSFSNLRSDLVLTDFIVPEGASVAFVDKRNGRITLDKAISTTAQVSCNINYEFKTIQATGIELNRITFRSRELSNRFDAIQKVRKFVAPNYIIRTQGDNKIWANYLRQKTTADYTLNLVKNITYLEDEDLYTRVKFFGKNKNPSNIMFDENVDFNTTGQSFRAITSQSNLEFEATEDNGWHRFGTTIGDAGRIILDNLVPVVFINNIPVDNTVRELILQPVTVQRTTRTETTVESSKWGGTDVSTKTFVFYKILFPHPSIQSDKPILCHNPNGTTIFTISPNDPNMNYGTGIYNSPGNTENGTLNQISTASYSIFYSTRTIEVDYDNVKFRINQSLLPDPTNSVVSATFEYYTAFTPQRGVASLIDGRLDTQVQTEFFSEPVTGFPYAIIDFGATKLIQAIDLVAGFYKPDEFRKFDVDMRLSLQSSTDNVNFFDISDETHNFQLTAGESISFEEDELGIGFEARYLLVVLENVKKIDFGNGVYPVAFTELSAYDDIIIESEATLTATTELTEVAVSTDTELSVTDTTQFTQPASGSTETAYIGTDAFTYSGLTSTSFTGVTIGSGVTGAVTDKVYQDVESDTLLKDDDDLLNQLGDRVFKEVRVSDQVLYSQSQLDVLAGNFLEEFYKDHTKLTVNTMYSPYLKVGQTIELTDPYNNINQVRYFIEGVSQNSGSYALTLARFPS